MGVAAVKIPSIFTAQDKYSKVVDKMTRTTANFAGRSAVKLARLDRGVRKLTPSFRGLNRMMGGFGGIFAGLGAIEIGRNIFGTITRFETGLVGVGKTTNMAGQELKDLGAKVIATSKKIKTISSEKLLELAQSAGQLGVTGSGNILKFATTLAKLEKASDIQGEEGASKIARLLTITGEGVGVVDNFSAALVGLGNTSAATESEILSVASEVGRATAAYKLQSQEILGISATLKSLDVRPEAAGTAVGKVFKGIELATIEGGKKLKNFAKVMDLTPKQVKEAFEKNPTKSFNMFIKGLNKISNEGGSVMKTMKDLGLGGEIVSKGIIPLATNYELLNVKMAKANEEFQKNSALNEEFAASQKTVQNAVNSIGIAFNNLILKQATAGSGLEKVQKALFFVADNMETIVVVGASVVGFFVAANAALKIWRIGLIAFNIVQGIQTALVGGSALALRGSAIAMQAFSIVTGLATTATGSFAVAIGVAGAPIWLIALAIIAIIALITAVIMKWNQWGAALSLLLGPLGMVISLIQSFRRNWDMIKESFKTGGILEGFKAIGKTILDAVLMPLQQVFQLMTNLPGVGDFAQKAVDGIAKFRSELGVNVETDESGKPLANAQASTEEARIDREESIQRNEATLKIEGAPEKSGLSGSLGKNIGIVMSSTQGFGE